MNFKKLVGTLIIIKFLLGASLVSASSIKQLDINELLINAELVFEGRVTAKKASWNESRTDIYTYVDFEVFDVIVGEYTGSILTLQFVGGTVDGATVNIQGSELPKLNERGIYFVESTTESLVNPLLGWSQGHFVMQADDLGEQRMLTQNKQAVVKMQAEELKESYLSKGVVTGVEAQDVSTVTPLQNAMTASDFKAQLRAQLKKLKR